MHPVDVSPGSSLLSTCSVFSAVAVAAPWYHGTLMLLRPPTCNLGGATGLQQPFLRAVGIILLAALGTGGLHALTCNNLLRAAWPVTFVDPWQVLCGLYTWTAVFFLMCQRRECVGIVVQSTNSGV